MSKVIYFIIFAFTVNIIRAIVINSEFLFCSKSNLTNCTEHNAMACMDANKTQNDEFNIVDLFATRKVFYYLNGNIYDTICEKVSEINVPLKVNTCTKDLYIYFNTSKNEKTKAFLTKNGIIRQNSFIQSCVDKLFYFYTIKKDYNIIKSKNLVLIKKILNETIIKETFFEFKHVITYFFNLTYFNQFCIILFFFFLLLVLFIFIRYKTFFLFFFKIFCDKSGLECDKHQKTTTNNRSENIVALLENNPDSALILQIENLLKNNNIDSLLSVGDRCCLANQIDGKSTRNEIRESSCDYKSTNNENNVSNDNNKTTSGLNKKMNSPEKNENIISNDNQSYTNAKISTKNEINVSNNQKKRKNSPKKVEISDDKKINVRRSSRLLKK